MKKLFTTIILCAALALPQMLAHANEPVDFEQMEMGEAIFTLVVGVVLFLFFIALWFLPALIAAHRSHRNTLAIFLVCLFLGWTGLGWVIALIWAVTRQPEMHVVVQQNNVPPASHNKSQP